MADPFYEWLICERIEREESAMPLIGAVADDLTGATTTGVLLARSKARTAVIFLMRKQHRKQERQHLWMQS